MSLPLPHLVPLGVALAWASVTDLRRRRIPNAVTLAVLASGLVVRGVDSEGGHRLLAVLSGLVASALVVVALFRPWSAGGVGGGDVKLAAAVAAWAGLEKLVCFALATAASGGVVALVCYLAARATVRADVRSNLTLALLQGRLPPVPSERDRGAAVPYALAIAAGAIVALLLGDRLA
jgi:prepilin peptidase CpaA